MTGPEHYREAERFAAAAGEWENADTGWKGALSTHERLARRQLDLAAAQVHATLAATATQQMLLPKMDEWMALASKDAPKTEDAPETELQP